MGCRQAARLSFGELLEKGRNFMKFKIKTYLWTGIIMGVFCAIMLAAMPSQVRRTEPENYPGYLSGGYVDLFSDSFDSESCI